MNGMKHQFPKAPNFSEKEILSMTAGKIWLVLSEHGRTSVPHLIKILQEKDSYVYLALGWLALEGKIDMSVKDKTEYVVLTDKEREIIPPIPKRENRSKN